MQKEGNKIQISQRMEHFDWLSSVEICGWSYTLKFANGKIARCFLRFFTLQGRLFQRMAPL